jgi:hypothetical protein
MAFQEMVEIDTKDPSEEVKKHQSNDVTSGNSLILKTESGLTDNIEQFLPNYSRELPFSFPTTEIFDIFSSSASKKHFQVIERNSSMATAVYKERYSFKNILLCCLTPEQRQKTIISAVRIHININESACTRVVHVKGIYGFPQVIHPLISDFQKRLDSCLKTSKVQKDSYDNLANEEEEGVVTCKHESSSYYQFHKILSSESYTLGKSISDFVASFSAQYRNPEESVAMLPLPLDSIKETVEQAVEALFTHYNYGRANTERMMVYCRPAVEKYVYSKIYLVLLPIYVCKTERMDLEVKRKRNEFLEFKDDLVFERLQIDDEFRSKEFYCEAVDILERLEDLRSPTEKVNCILNMNNAVKSAVIDLSKGSLELSELKAEIKAIAFIILKSKIEKPSAEIELVKDYLGSRLGNEHRGVYNFTSAINYIISEII